MTDITELALLVSKAKASVFTLEYISQFEPADIDSDDVDLRFEVDGRDTGTNVSIVDECGQAAKVIGALVEALEYYKSREERVTSLVRDNSKSWDELYRQVEAKGKRNVELVEALEKAQQRIVELDRKNCELDSLTQRWAVERAENADRIAELESRAVTFKLPSTPEPSAFAPWVAKAFYQFHKDTVKSCVAVFSDACRAAGIKVEVE